MLIDAAIDPASYQSKKQQEKKTTLQVFFFLFTWPVRPSGIYGTPLLLLMLLIKDKSKKGNANCACWRGISGFTDQWTALTDAQRTILQSQILICA